MCSQISITSINSYLQVDYTGSKQGEKRKPREPSKFPIETPHEAPVTLNTTVRVDYQSPNQKGSLQSNTTRYGCNANRASVATGAGIANMVRCAIWYHLHNSKNVKNTHGGVLILVKLTSLSIKR